MASRKSKGKSVILALVCIVLGFMLAFSYKLANKEQSSSEKLTDPQFARETELRKQLIRLKQDNRSLQKELEKNKVLFGQWKKTCLRKNKFF